MTRTLDPASRAYPFFTMSRKPPLRLAAKPFPSCVGRSRSPGSGGARRDRTDDLLLAKQALSQLSYGPVSSRPFQANDPDRERHQGVVGLERFELSTSRLSSARSNQLSYRPGKRSGRPNEERETKAAVSRRHIAEPIRFQNWPDFLMRNREVGHEARPYQGSSLERR